MEKLIKHKNGQWELLKSDEEESQPPVGSVPVPNTPLHVLHDSNRSNKGSSGNRYHVYHGADRVGTIHWQDGSPRSTMHQDHHKHLSAVEAFTGKMPRHD